MSLARRLHRLEGQAKDGPPIVLQQSYPDEPTADCWRRQFGEEMPADPGRLVVVIRRFGFENDVGVETKADQ